MTQTDTVVISDILKQYQQEMTRRSAPPMPFGPASKGQARLSRVTPLAELTTDHLADQKQIETLKAAIAAARRWVSRREEGKGMILTGGVGTGKTTIALNLKQAMAETVAPLDDNLQVMLELSQIVPRGQFVTAQRLMDLLDPAQPEKPAIEKLFVPGLCRVVVVDDIGSEEMPYAGAELAMTKRQSRYREFFDHCWRRRIGVIVTSNVPLYAGQNQINPDFVNIIGLAAMDRLWETSFPYCIDLTGLPSFRQWQVNQ